MGLNIYVFLFIGLFVHSINAQCTQQEQDSVRSCLKQATQGSNAGVLQLATLNSQAGPCLTQAGCNGAQSSSGFAGAFGSFFGGGQQPPPQQQPSNGNDEQCYNAVTKQVRQAMGQCIKQKSPKFNQNDAGFGGGKHQGGGQGGGQGQQSNVNQQLSQKCNGDKVKIRKVKACMLNTPAGQQQYQQIVQQGCQCKTKVSPPCQQQLETHRKAACQCAHDMNSQRYEQFEQQNTQICQGQTVEPDGIVAVFQKMDCNQDPCQNQG